MSSAGLYIHFPFCNKKCAYCDFPSYSGMENYMDKYLIALRQEMDTWVEPLSEHTIETIFMGGGTPTLFDGIQLASILNYIFDIFHVSESAEITIEANPGTIDSNKAFTLKNAGFNRLSMGLQAYQNKHLLNLGRIHNVKDWITSMEHARTSGFDNINVDLMFGLPGQTLEEWVESLEGIINIGVEHVSAYGLKIEEGTLLAEQYREDRLSHICDELERLMYHKAIDILEKNDLIQYEISNFAVKGKECKHNLNYWENGIYAGIGCGAYSYLNGERFGNSKDIIKYIKHAAQKDERTVFSEYITDDMMEFETIMLSLRLRQGIDKEKFLKKYKVSFEKKYNQILLELKKKTLLLKTKVLYV